MFWIPQWPLGETGWVGDGAAAEGVVVDMPLMDIDIDIDIVEDISDSIIDVLVDVRLSGPPGKFGPMGVAVAVYVE